MKNILLALVGLSPQVVTETLFALHQHNRRVDEIHIITTRRGREMINAHLLPPNSGMYYRYLKEYGFNSSEINFNHNHVHVVADRLGIEIDDIATEEHNESVLNLCLDLAFRFTRKPDKAVFFSLAGGRKTMSSCLTLAAQLYGRPQDRLYHVLVTPEFESNRNFYYPPRKSKPLELKDERGRPYIKETKYARVTLIPIPFVSIREKIPADMLMQPMDPAEIMLSLIREDEYVLDVDLVDCKLKYKGVELDMTPAHLALLAFFAVRKKECTREAAVCDRCDECFLNVTDVFENQDRITDLYKRLCGGRVLSEMSDTGIINLNADNFRSMKSKIRKDIETCFGIYAADEAAVSSSGRRPNTRYGLKIDKNKLRIIM